MTAAEIRNRAELITLDVRTSGDMATQLVHLTQFVAELAAQMADYNERQAGLTSQVRAQVIDEALAGLQMEQRLHVKGQLIRAGLVTE